MVDSLAVSPADMTIGYEERTSKTIINAKSKESIFLFTLYLLYGVVARSSSPFSLMRTAGQAAAIASLLAWIEDETTSRSIS